MYIYTYIIDTNICICIPYTVCKYDLRIYICMCMYINSFECNVCMYNISKRRQIYARVLLVLVILI